MKKVAIIISPNYKDYAKKYLDDCLESLRKQDYQGEMKIFITDNESSDESFFYMQNKLKYYFGGGNDFNGSDQEPAKAGWNLSGKNEQEPDNLVSREEQSKAGRDNKENDKDFIQEERELIIWEIIRNEHNDGFAKGNNDSMRLAIKQGFDYIILFNMDTIVEPNCVSEMVKAAESDNNPPCTPLAKGGIGAVQARLMLWPERDKINSLGNATHFLGFGYCIGYNTRIKNHELRIKDIFYPSGAAVLFKREVLEQVQTSPRPSPCEGEGEYFDEEFWMYNEDQDLGWRIWLAGYKCVLAPEAIVFHKYQFAKSIKQYYWMDRNRIIAMIKNYRFGTMVLIFPAFVIMELGLILFSLKTGWFKEKMRVWRYFLTPAKWKYLRNARKQVQALRKVKDRDIIDMISGKIWYQEIDDVKLKLINPIFNLYWSIIRFFIIW